MGIFLPTSLIPTYRLNGYVYEYVILQSVVQDSDPLLYQAKTA